MQKRVLNLAAWLLLIAASVLAVGGFNGPGQDLLVFLLVGILAVMAIILFKLAGWTCTTTRVPNSETPDNHAMNRSGGGPRFLKSKSNPATR